jgi:hypothetical protein
MAWEYEILEVAFMKKYICLLCFQVKYFGKSLTAIIAIY